MFMPGSTGGAERMTILIAKTLIQNNFQVKIVVVDHEKGNIESFIPKDAEVEFIKCRHISLSINSIYKCIKRNKPQKVFTSLGHLAPHVLMASKLCGVPAIIRIDLGLSEIGPVTKFIRSKTYPLAEKIISQTEEMRQEYINVLGIDEKTIVTLQNPIDKESIAEKLKETVSPYPPSDSVNYLWVGRFHHNKGQDVLAKAFSIVAQRIPQSNLYFVGAYKDDDSFYKSVKESIVDIKERVHFVGFDNNPYRWMKYCDCFVMPSRKEGLPNALIEAMYLGRPVVATRCIPVIDRLVDSGRNGIVVPMDDAELLSKAMIDALDLRDCSSNYQSAKEEDYVELFKQ